MFRLPKCSITNNELESSLVEVCLDCCQIYDKALTKIVASKDRYTGEAIEREVCPNCATNYKVEV